MPAKKKSSPSKQARYKRQPTITDANKRRNIAKTERIKKKKAEEKKARLANNTKNNDVPVLKLPPIE